MPTNRFHKFLGKTFDLDSIVCIEDPQPNILMYDRRSGLKVLVHCRLMDKPIEVVGPDAEGCYEDGIYKPVDVSSLTVKEHAEFVLAWKTFKMGNPQ
jgi:hypothetical protein